MHLASQAGYPKFIQLLLEHAANVNKRTHYGWTPLHHAVCYASGYFDAIRLLLQHDTNVDNEDELGKGSVALHLASSIEIMLAFLKCGVDLNTRDGDGARLLKMEKNLDITTSHSYC